MAVKFFIKLTYVVFLLLLMILERKKLFSGGFKTFCEQDGFPPQEAKRLNRR